MDRWAGRVAVVTGAAGGIGSAIVKDLVTAGMVVVGVDLKDAPLQELASSLSSQSGKLHPLSADLRRVDEVRRVYQWTEDNLGAVSVVVNSAAINPMNPLPELGNELIENVVSINLTSVMVSCKEAVNSMLKHEIRDGHVINLNSTQGHVVKQYASMASVTAYATTKHGITALCQGLRYDVQKIPDYKIRVTSICPGGTQTNMLSEEYVKSFKDPEMILKPSDVSGAVLYALACPSTVEISELTVQAVR